MKSIYKDDNNDDDENENHNGYHFLMFRCVKLYENVDFMKASYTQLLVPWTTWYSSEYRWE